MNLLIKSKKGKPPLPRTILSYDLRYDVNCFVGKVNSSYQMLIKNFQVCDANRFEW